MGDTVVEGKDHYFGCWLSRPSEDFDGIIQEKYVAKTDLFVPTGYSQIAAYCQASIGTNTASEFVIGEGGYAKLDHIMMSLDAPAAWAPAEGETLTEIGGGWRRDE
jgi:hypothetical protein